MARVRISESGGLRSATNYDDTRASAAVAITITQESPSSLAEYARVSIAFEVRRALDIVSAGEHAPFRLDERDVESYMKDYDSIDGGPLAWASRFDLSAWAFFLARDAGRPVGGAACVFRAPDVRMLDGQDDVALLWDIRVAPEARSRGVGSALLSAVERWSVERAAVWLEVETQDVNVPACRFYERHGFELRSLNRNAYPELPHETQLLWYKHLPRSRDGGQSR